MAIAFRAASSGTTTIAAPTGAQAGDLLLLYAESSGAFGTVTIPAGWATLRTATDGNNFQHKVAYRLYAGSGSPWTLTGAGQHVCAAYSGVDQTTPIIAENIATNFGNATITSPTVNNAAASGAWRVSGWLHENNTVPIAFSWGSFSPSDTKRLDAPGSTSTFGIAAADSGGPIASGNTSITGTVNDGNANFGSSAVWIGILKPATVSNPAQFFAMM